MPKVMPITLGLAAAVLAVPAANAQVTPDRDTRSPWETVRQTPTTADASSDTAFIRQAIRGNYTEVALGRLAESRAENDDVEDFAERMVTDHNDMNEQWADLAKDQDMRITLEFGPEGQQVIERLEDLEGAQFDQAYMTEMLRHHERDLAAFQRMSTSARSTEVRQLASSGATKIREHLALAQQVGSRVGVATTAGRAGGVTTPLPAPRTPTTTTPTPTTRPTPTTTPTPLPAPSDDRDRRVTRDDDSEAREVRRSLRREDRVFIDGVLSDHLMHLRLANRVQRQARDEETRRLAERIEEDFTRWSERWERFADRRNAEVTSHLERQHRARIERLRKASERTDLDHAYAAIVADHLEALVKDFREEANEKRPGAVRRLIQEELPTLRKHLARARQLEARDDDRKN